MTGGAIIDVRGLGKQYAVATRRSWLRSTRSTVTALDDVSFTVQRGECFGLLGPNGAGKTTLIKCLTTLLVPNRGTAVLNGFDVVRQPAQVCASVGCMLMGERGVYWKLTGRENLEYFAALYFRPRAERRGVVDGLVARLGLGAFIDRAVETYSSGQRMRIAFARALIHDAPILLLDEPTNTLDVHGARELRALVRELHGLGRTIVYSTHLMTEAEELCDRVAIVDRGRIAAIGAPRELVERAERHVILRVTGRLPPATLTAMQRHPAARSASLLTEGDRDVMTVGLLHGSADVAPLLTAIGDAGGEIRDLRLDHPSLEEVFLELTGRRPETTRAREA
jgi:ABC-2 type transport system ATP-binding protein